ncbi:MAG: hypothetical protein ACK5XN_21785 [Bacteroidota bacterium]
MSIEERLARVEKILDARGLDWDHPKIGEAKAEQQTPPAKPERWRLLADDEVIQAGEWYNAKANEPGKWPPHGGWHQLEDNDICIGLPAGNFQNLLWCREVTDDANETNQSPDASEKVEEPEPEHPAGPKPDPGEGYRLLSKDPPEELLPGDEYRCIFHREKQWIESGRVREGCLNQLTRLWYRRKIEQPAEPAPAWDPKAGDLVLVTRPEDWKEWQDPQWRGEMHVCNGKFLRVENVIETSVGERVKLYGCDYFFHRDWLAPSIKHFADAAQHKEPPKPAEPQYRIPSLPDDAGKVCEFSDDGSEWFTDTLIGFSLDDDTAPWVAKECLWDHARITDDKAEIAPSKQWEPQVGDWVMVSAPGRSNVSVSISWCRRMNQYVRDAREITRILYEDSHGFVVSLEGCELAFHTIWLEPMRKAQFDLD